MKVVQFNPDTLKEAVEILKKGGVVAHPTDTCYGLAGDIMNPKALEKIQSIKGRDNENPMSIMISVPEQLKIKNYVALDEFSVFVACKLFPSPVTLILNKGPKIPKHYFPNSQTIGLRVPLHDQTQDLLMAFNGPLITTSANHSGAPICFEHKDVTENFKASKDQPDLVFMGKSTQHNQASTVITIENERVVVKRQGPITVPQLQSILKVPVEG